MVPSGSNIKATLPYDRVTHTYTRYIGLGNAQALKQLAGDKFYMAIPTRDNVEHSVCTYENRPPRNYNTLFHEKAFQHIKREYSHIFPYSTLTSEQVWEFIDLSKSTGYPGNHYGFSNKAQLIKHEPFTRWLLSNQHLMSTPIWCVHPKEEFKELDDLKQNKIRLFTIPPLDLLYEQVRFGKISGERLKNYKWSAYGFNPYKGGANVMAHRLLSKRIRLFYDISGWDKFLAIMKEMYERFIIPATDPPPELRDNFLWMAFNTFSFLFKTPHGHVFEKIFGNPSGSGTTTRDNILAHIIILAAALIEVYYLKYNEFPPDALLIDQVVYLFGDDNAMGLDPEFDLILENEFLFRHFEKYGMKLKFLHGGYDYPIEQIQFLGFHFKLMNGIYVPKYDVQRLATSVVYANGRNSSREAFTSRLFILMIMSYPTEEAFPIFRAAYKEWCSYLMTLYDTLSPAEKTFYDMANISDSDIMGLYSGLESSFDVSFFSSDNWMEEGII